jgi:hypothetical protein
MDSVVVSVHHCDLVGNLWATLVTIFNLVTIYSVGHYVEGESYTAVPHDTTGLYPFKK